MTREISIRDMSALLNEHTALQVSPDDVPDAIVLKVTGATDVETGRVALAAWQERVRSAQVMRSHPSVDLLGDRAPADADGD